MQKMEIPSNMFVVQITKKREVNESHALNYYIIESKYIVDGMNTRSFTFTHNTY